MCLDFLMHYQLFMENLKWPVTLRSHSTKGRVDLQDCKTAALATYYSSWCIITPLHFQL